MRAVILGIVASVGVVHAQPSEPTPPQQPTPAPEPGPDSGLDPDTPAIPARPEPPATSPSAPASDQTTEPAATADVSAPDAAATAPAAPVADTVSAPVAPAAAPSKNKDAAWLFVGGALTFVTAGVVLAYSTSSSEQDLRDLYTAAGNSPAEYDAETRERYDDLVAEGKRYERLSWTSFGLAAGCAIGATIFFIRASRESDVAIVPAITPTSAGLSISLLAW